MKKPELQWIMLLVAALALLTGGGVVAAEKSESLSIATGGTGGTYYKLGFALATGISGQGIPAKAQTGDGSVSNCNLIASGDVDTAFVQNNIADEAYNGLGSFEGHAVTNLRAIAALYPETVQVVARKAANVKNLRDAKGKIIAVGEKGSGTEVDTRNILSFHNLTFDDITPIEVNFSEAAKRLQGGQADVLFITAGYPTTSIIMLMSGKECNFVNIDQEAVEKLCARYPFYTPVSIPANTYKGQAESVNTIALMALWVTSSNLDDEVVYKFTKALWAKGHNARSGVDVMAEIHEQGKNIKLETCS